MKHKIKKYPVESPVLKNYIKFFWEIQAENMNICHNLIPVRNIDLKFNLNDTSHYLISNGYEKLIDSVYFHGLRDIFTQSQLKLSGNVHVLGVCFHPFGMYPFVKIPVSEFRNKLLNANEIGFTKASEIREKMMDVSNISERLTILEKELLSILQCKNIVPNNFNSIFNCVKEINSSVQIFRFCQHHNIHIRKLERDFNKYVGISAKAYGSLLRFQNSVNQLLYQDYEKLTDIAYCHGYYDQMHFIKEFKRFSGNTPGNFANRSNSMLQIGEFN